MWLGFGLEQVRRVLVVGARPALRRAHEAKRVPGEGEGEG